MADVVRRWRDFERTLVGRGLGWALHYAPPQLRYTRTAEHPHGAVLDHLLPSDYQAFVTEVGYPVFGFDYYDREGTSFLPPEPMARLSVNLPDAEDVWLEAVAGEPTRCRFAFFAGFDLSDIEGYAFGSPVEGGKPVVWRVERGMAREVVHRSFTEWLTGEIDRWEATVAELDDADVAAMREENDGEEDPHRLLDYSLGGTYDQAPFTAADLDLAWVEDEATESFGLIDGAGAWVIPHDRRFRVVRPFRAGSAEVIHRTGATSHAGPWSILRLADESSSRS